jgi:site-specific DNA-methyltransferase (adenine-specific)
MVVRTEALFSSKSNNWETPQDFFDKINDEFHFTLDVCATEQNTKCTNYYTVEQDGLAQPWTGVVWCNPPYGKAVKRWCKKAAEANCTVVMLLPARTDTAWFHDYIYGKAELRFIRSRLKFGNADRAPFPSMLAIFRR